MDMLQSAFGLVVMFAFAYAISENRKAIAWRSVASGVALQIVVAIFLTRVPAARDVFLYLNDAVTALNSATIAGTSFVFGYLGGGELPFKESYPGAGFVLAFQALPLIIVMSALSALLYHWRVVPLVVGALSRVLQKTMGIGGAIGLATAANIFVGMIVAPVLIKPYLQRMSRGELFIVMTSGMATIAGTVLVLYATFLKDTIPNALGHILVASVISAPAAILVGMIMVPHEGEPTKGVIDAKGVYDSSMDAVSKGTSEGATLLIQVMAMLICFVALVALANSILGLLPDVGGTPITLQRILGLIMSPVVWLIGIPWQEAQTAGALMGTKTVLNELIAYLDMSKLPAEALSERSRLIMTYSMCGFANFGSLGILIGGLGALVPERRDEIVSMGMKSIVSGTMATCMTGAVIGMVYW